MNELLENFLETKNIPHALLFSGRNLTYIKEQAYLFASKIILSDLNNSSTQALQKEEICRLNIYEYYPKGKIELHPIETIRQLIAEAWKPNFTAMSKIFIIYAADRMLPSAAAALLKIFEEPQQNVFIILVSSKIEKLSPAILSRSIVVSFKQQEKAYQTEIQTELFAFLRKDLRFISVSEIGLMYQNIEAVLKKKEVNKEEDLVKQAIKNLLQVIYLCFRDKFLLGQNINEKLLSFPEDKEMISQLCCIPLEKIHHIIQYAAEALEKASHKQFVLEWLFLQIERLSRYYSLKK